MQYFSFLPKEELHSLFCQPPLPFDRDTPLETLRNAVGGLLYTPASNPDIAQIVLTGKIQGLTSLAICLEDAVGDAARRDCMVNAKDQIAAVAAALRTGALPPGRLPLLFLRVKDNDMLEELGGFLADHSDVVTGAILPKADGSCLERGLALTAQIRRQAAYPFYLMPILESRALMETRDRIGLLQDLRGLTDQFYPLVLNIRMGATDLCGLYGIRRGMDTSIYRIGVVAGCIADVVRVFGLDGRYTISGPVWEYFRTLTSALATGQWEEISGLVQEVGLDLQNGILGKTCIHPAQLLPVQASLVVPAELFQDAASILCGNQDRSGVLSSCSRNKMNELKPHTLWARRIMRRAEVYGVYAGQTDAIGFLRALYSTKHTAISQIAIGHPPVGITF